MNHKLKALKVTGVPAWLIRTDAEEQLADSAWGSCPKALQSPGYQAEGSMLALPGQLGVRGGI